MDDLYGLLFVAGCGNDLEQARKLQAKRQNDLQSKSQQDNLGDVFELLETFIELDDVKATRQIVYHLNRWKADRPVESIDALNRSWPCKRSCHPKMGQKGHGTKLSIG